MKDGCRWGGLLLAIGALASAVVGGRKFGRWQRTWGATENEAAEPLPGDQYVESPQYRTTRAITVDAAAEDLFPWLAQMGYHRGGLYSYDFLDRMFGILDAPSTREIVPEWQDLKVGDVIPLGKGSPFPVVELEPNRWLVLAGTTEGVNWSWSMVLRPTGDGRLRFLTRNHGKGMGAGLPLLLLDVAAFVMVRRWLLVLKARAEKTARERRSRATEGPVPESREPQSEAVLV